MNNEDIGKKVKEILRKVKDTFHPIAYHYFNGCNMLENGQTHIKIDAPELDLSSYSILRYRPCDRRKYNPCNRTERPIGRG